MDGKPQSFSFPANLVDHSGDESLAFIEKLWAVRRVGEILDEMDLKGKNEELVKELVRLSTGTASSRPTRRSWPTRTGPTGADGIESRRISSDADRRLDALKQTDGELGVEQRAAKSALQNARSPASHGVQRQRMRVTAERHIHVCSIAASRVPASRAGGCTEVLIRPGRRRPRPKPGPRISSSDRREAAEQVGK